MRTQPARDPPCPSPAHLAPRLRAPSLPPCAPRRRPGAPPAIHHTSPVAPARKPPKFPRLASYPRDTARPAPSLRFGFYFARFGMRLKKSLAASLALSLCLLGHDPARAARFAFWLPFYGLGTVTKSLARPSRPFSRRAQRRGNVT